MCEKLSAWTVYERRPLRQICQEKGHAVDSHSPLVTYADGAAQYYCKRCRGKVIMTISDAAKSAPIQRRVPRSELSVAARESAEEEAVARYFEEMY